MVPIHIFFKEVSWQSTILSGSVCPARTGPLEGPNFSSEDGDLPCLASSLVKIAIVTQNCAKLGKYRGSEPEFSPFSSRMRAGQQGRRSH